MCLLEVIHRINNIEYNYCIFTHSSELRAIWSIYSEQFLGTGLDGKGTFINLVCIN